MVDRQRWAVVGGGIAGLLAARRLARAGHDVTLLEAESQLGGRVSRVRLDGLEIDAAAESFATRGDHVIRLLTELGLDDRVVTPTRRPAWVVAPDAEYPLPTSGWLGVPTVLLGADARAALGWRGAWRMVADLMAGPQPVSGDDSIDAVARARLGDLATDRLIAPVVRGIFSRPLTDIRLSDIDPSLADQISRQGMVRTAVARRAAAPAGAAVMGIEGGVATLADALADDARRAGARIVLEAPVAPLMHRDGAWHLSAGGGTLVADHVAVAVPRANASALVPHLDRAEDRRVAVVMLSLDAPELDSAPRGTGVLVAGGVTRAKALTHSTAKWAWLARRAEGRHVVRLSYPGEHALDAGEHALRDASRLLGVDLTERQVRDMVRVSWHDTAPSAVAHREPVPGVHLIGSAAGLSGIAAIVAADADAGRTGE